MLKLKTLTSAFLLAAALAAPAAASAAQNRQGSCEGNGRVALPFAYMSLTSNGKKISEKVEMGGLAGMLSPQQRAQLNRETSAESQYALDQGRMIVIDGSALTERWNYSCGSTKSLRFLTKAGTEKRLKESAPTILIVDFNGSSDNRDMPFFGEGIVSYVQVREVAVKGQKYDEMTYHFEKPLTQKIVRQIEKAKGFAVGPGMS